MPTRRVGGRRGRKPVRIIGARPHCKCLSVSVVFVIFRDINPSRPRPSHSANDRLSHLVQKF